MSERKPTNQSWEGFTEQLIQDAQRTGAFSNLSGFGQPIPGIEKPLEENWWIRRKLRDEKLDLLPPLLEAKRDIERTREEIGRIRSEPLVRVQLEQLKERVQKAIMSPIPSPPVVVLPIDVEAELQRWRDRRDGD